MFEYRQPPATKEYLENYDKIDWEKDKKVYREVTSDGKSTGYTERGR